MIPYLRTATPSFYSLNQVLAPSSPLLFSLIHLPVLLTGRAIQRDLSRTVQILDPQVDS